MIRVALLFLDLCRPLFRWMNVPFEQVRAIVGVKLLLDTRRTGALTSLNQSETSSSTIFAYIFYTIMGALTGFLLAIVPSSIVGYALHYSFLMFFIALILISDYSSVILDTSDNTIILPRPVSSRTLLVARITHIVLYIGQLFLCLAAIPLVVSFVVHGWMAGVANIIASLLSVLLAFAATGGLYLLLIRFFKEERLKSVINVVQIFTTIFLLTSYQILPRLFEAADVENMLDYLPVWSLVVPPLWMAGSVTVFVDQPFTALAGTCMLLAIITPFLLIWLSTKYLAPLFASRLADLGTSTVKTAPAETPATWWDKIASHVTQPGAERAAFQVVIRYFSRDRKLKLRIYPSIGYFLVLAVLFLVRTKDNSQTWSNFFDQLPHTHGYFMLLYLVIFVVMGAAFEIYFSDEFKAAWIYYATPVEYPGKVLMGTLKAVFMQFFLPFYMLVSVLVLAIWGYPAVPAILVALLMNLFVFLLSLFATEKSLPLSLQPTLRNQNGNFVRGIIAFMLIGSLGFGHFSLAGFGHWQWMLIPILLAANFLFSGWYAKTRWARIRQ
jgi:ABC-2 type transport system permease protein